jgi:two-component system, LytTR family, response regulator
LRRISVIIADDEPLARERVRAVLEGEPDVDVVAECADGSQAVNATKKHQPDVLFLDVQMPRFSGFEVLEAIRPGPMPIVIFTTAFDEHAIRAFEYNAMDYLLKPFTEARFKMSLQRVRARLEEGSWQIDPKLKVLMSQMSGPVVGGGRICVRSSERILFLKPGEIDRVEAAGNYVLLHSGGERHILRETISAMEARLGAAGFMRVSRSVIVNLGNIREIRPAGAGRYSLLLKSGAKVDMTCSLSDLQAQLGEI